MTNNNKEQYAVLNEETFEIVSYHDSIEEAENKAEEYNNSDYIAVDVRSKINITVDDEEYSMYKPYSTRQLEAQGAAKWTGISDAMEVLECAEDGDKFVVGQIINPEYYQALIHQLIPLEFEKEWTDELQLKLTNQYYEWHDTIADNIVQLIDDIDDEETTYSSARADLSKLITKYNNLAGDFERLPKKFKKSDIDRIREVVINNS